MVDNGSRDGQVEKAKKNYPWVKFFFLGRNTGFAYACNYASRFARGKSLLFLNQDSEITENAILEVFDFLEKDSSRGIASGRILYPDGRIQETIRRFPGYADFIFGRKSLLTRLFPRNPWIKRYLYMDISFDKPRPVDVCTGMFLMIKRELFETLGGFDEGFFFYVEDMDLCKRSAELGYVTWFVPVTSAVHHVGENIQGIDRTYVKMHHYKGIYRYLVKHKHPGSFLKTLLWVAAGLAITAHVALSRTLKSISLI